MPSKTSIAAFSDLMGRGTFIVAEVGVNHNGDLSRAIQLIDAAADAGCDAVKFQKRTPSICVPEHQRSVMRDTPWGKMSYMEYRQRMEFERNEFNAIAVHCEHREISWFASAWDIHSLKFLETFDPVFHKIPSPCLTEDELIKAASKLNRPLLLSTGMSTRAQIDHAVALSNRNNLSLLHCTSSYPTKDAELNLRVIPSMRARYGAPVGYSGHEEDFLPSYLAVAVGAWYVERHITFDKEAIGSDHRFSLLPAELKELVAGIRRTEVCLGDGEKQVFESEKPALNKLRRS